MVAEVPMPGCLCSTLCNGLLPCGSGGCKSDGKSGCCKSGGKSGESGGKSGGKSGAAAVKFLSASVSGGVFLCGSKQEQKYFRNATLVITYFYISAADTGLELVERGLIKVLHFNYSKFLLCQLRNWALFSKR